MKTLILPALLLGALAFGTPAFAQQSHSGHGSHGAAPAKAGEAPSSAAYRAVNTKMHKDMDIPLTGDADVDFVKGMIPHHQGAIDMARVVLQHGKDPQLKTLANSIIADQEREIAMMRDWLKAKGH